MKPGERLHKYTILDELGRGGMGGVYVAEEDGTGRQVAIKTLFKRFAEEEAYVRRFQREAQVYRQLEHPNIIHYIESGFDNGTYFIVLEYVRGKTLGEIMYDQGRLDPVPSLKITIGLAEALRHAHDKGIVHRDLKPSNVIVDETGEVRLLDFGVAHKEDQLVRTQEGTVVGTFFYAAPEQNQGKKRIDARTDIYTLGIVLYEMLTGRRPFEGDLLEVAAEQARESYVPVEEIVPDVPHFLPQIVRRLMAKNPEDRYQTCAALLEELRAALTALTVRGVPAPNLGMHPSAHPVDLGIDDSSLPPLNSLPIGLVSPPSAPAPGGVTAPPPGFGGPQAVVMPSVPPVPAASVLAPPPAPSAPPVSLAASMAHLVAPTPPRSDGFFEGAVTMPAQPAPVLPPTPAPVVAPPVPAAPPVPPAPPVASVPPAPPVAPVPPPTPEASSPPAAEATSEPEKAPEPTSSSGIGQGLSDTRWHGAKEAFQSRKLDKAQELAEAVVASAPGFAPGHDLLGKIHSAKGFTYNAIESFKLALSLAPQDVQMHMDYAMALYTMKLPQKSLDAFEDVLRLDPKNMLAVRYIQLIQDSDGDVSAPRPGEEPARNVVEALDTYTGGGNPLEPASSSLYGESYAPPPTSPEPVVAAPQPPSPQPPSLAPGAVLPPGAVSMAPPGPAPGAPPPVSLAPPPVSLAPPGGSEIPPPVSLAPPPSASSVSVPPPVVMPGSSPVAPAVPPAGVVTPPTPPPGMVMAPSTSGPPQRTPEFVPPPAPMDEEPLSGDPDEDVPGRRFTEKKKQRRKKSLVPNDGIRLDPDRAWNLGMVWWGLGASYVGSRSRGFYLTVLEIVALAMLILPFLPEVELAIRSFQGSLGLADHLADTEIFSRGGAFIQWVAETERDWAPALREFMKDLGPEVTQGVGLLLMLWFESTLPGDFYEKARFANLLGSILEVRKDGTLKISLGEDRGVEEGMIFRVEKRKHVDKLSEGNFRTMIMAPQVFAIGEAKVIAVNPDSALCKFRRIKGQASNPSAQDRVVILRRP